MGLQLGMVGIPLVALHPISLPVGCMKVHKCRWSMECDSCGWTKMERRQRRARPKRLRARELRQTSFDKARLILRPRPAFCEFLGRFLTVSHV